MAVIKTESVVITNSRLAKGFNGDSFNLNGKAVSTENANKGFKAAGEVKPPYYSVIASCNQKGFASGAVTAFNDYVKNIGENKYNAETVLERYFDDMDAVMAKCDVPDTRLSIGIVYVDDDCVIAAKTGGCHILRYSEGELFEIALSDEDNGRGYQFIDALSDGDMFALVGEDCAADLDYDGIVTSFDKTVDLKEIFREFFGVIAARAKGRDCSVALIKISSDTPKTYAAGAPGKNSDKDSGRDEFKRAGFDAEPPIDADEFDQYDDEPVSDSEMPESGKGSSAKKKILRFIPIAVLVIILAIAAALYFSSHLPGFLQKEGESTGDLPPIFVGSNDDKEGETNDGDFNGSNGMETVEDTEQGGNAGGVGDNNDSNEPTTNPPQTTPSTPTTAAPTTSAPTTAAPTTDNNDGDNDNEDADNPDGGEDTGDNNDQDVDNGDENGADENGGQDNNGNEDNNADSGNDSVDAPVGDVGGEETDE